LRQDRLRINNQIRSAELRVIDDEGGNLGVISSREAVKIAQERGLDLIEISPNAQPPVAKITDYGKFQYELKKKAKAAKAGTKITETKVVQVKIGTGDHDLNLKAKNVSKWLKEGHRVKVDLYLVGRAKYSDDEFKKERLERILKLITEEYKVAEEPQRSPKGFTIVIEHVAGKKK
jgi:translation initiation factor IF-3